MYGGGDEAKEEEKLAGVGEGEDKGGVTVSSVSRVPDLRPRLRDQFSCGRKVTPFLVSLSSVAKHIRPVIR